MVRAKCTTCRSKKYGGRSPSSPVKAWERAGRHSRITIGITMQRDSIQIVENSWRRIPDGVRVRHQTNGDEGAIDGITQIVEGPRRNPDRLTQYRIDVGGPTRKLAAEEELLIVLDDGG